MSEPLPEYAELHCLSAFSFQRGASTARELFARAATIGYRALAITDECSLAGIVRAWEAARDTGVPLIVGSEMPVGDGPKLVLLVEHKAGYEALCRMITTARRRASKGEYRLLRRDIEAGCEGLLALWLPSFDEDFEAHATWLHARFPSRTWIAVELHRGVDDAERLQRLRELGTRYGLPLVASGDVHMHVRARRRLQDVLACVRHHTTLADAGERLFPNGERHLRIRQALAAIYPRELLAETVRIAERCRFDLKAIRYEYPRELVPAAHTPTSWLRTLTETGIRRRWPDGCADKVRASIEHELSVIADLGYEPYFLTVHDIVEFARSRGILCQGRGSAANSAVCFALGITEVDPARMELLFERFISKERKEAPDIDVDFEHERREEVLQYVFSRYGRARAALTAVVSHYRTRGAIRDVARVFGLPVDSIDELTKAADRWSSGEVPDERINERGFEAASPLLRQIMELAGELTGFPRHLSQHPGGFVISEHSLEGIVPVENAAMDERTIVQWDKDDLDALGILKVDCLALGMLTAVRKTFESLARLGHGQWSMATIPADDAPTYAMIGRADTIGVFQIESRAQMAMLPRMQPACFYDLVIQVAIVRPGPIQGDMVHPYLRRRRGQEPITYPSRELEEIFKRTLGVPLFQEQVMQIAIRAAGFTPGEADALRRSMAAWKRHGGLEPHRKRLLDGMLERGYTQEFAERLFEQIKGFGSYGFPESHAASFALVTYVSCWLKCRYPAVFAASVINSMPMGFYSADQLLQDARRHGIAVRPVDVRFSDWNCTLEPDPRSRPGPSVEGDERTARYAIRMGLRLVKGFDEASANRISRARDREPFEGIDDLVVRAGLDAKARSLLADSGALKALAGHRHRARWAVVGVEAQLPLLAGVAIAEDKPDLPLPSVGEDLLADYALTGTTLGRHPLAQIRSTLHARRCMRSSQLARLPHGRRVQVAGLVTLRQRPGTASGVTFLTLEDEDGLFNVVVWRAVADRQRREVVESRLLKVDGRLERVEGVQHVIAHRFEDLGALLPGLAMHSRDFH
ncbi:error-prone DNA polymerase [Lysobacter korlensis]|uniref:Error-prone DNA polymerase n=1 Tax=Lysobacter korlensis TaxID=553636 RepID=A0ABV6RPN4_9GAMM